MTEKELEFQLYGQYLTGSETELEKAKLARARYLKVKMRKRLAAEIGDDPDTITDIMRAVLLCYSVSVGIVTDPDVIARLNVYIVEMLAGYAGPGNIMDVLEYDKAMIQQHVLMGYFAAKAQLMAADTVEEVCGVDLPGEPV